MHEPIFLPHPLWFASEELLADVLRNEVKAVTQLLAKYPDLRDLFDDPAATVPQRKACFMLLAHRKIMDIIYEIFTGLYQESPSLGDEESNALSGTENLVKGDAPAWVLELNELVGRLPWKISAALPEPLRAEGFYPDNSRQVETIKVAAKALSSVDQIQELTRGVIDQQLRRLERRWSAANVQVRGLNELEDSERRLKGIEGLVRKADLSRYMHNLTKKQQLAFSLRYEYELGLSEIAARMGINRKTAYEHIKAAEKKVKETRSGEKRKARRAKKTPEF